MTREAHLVANRYRLDGVLGRGGMGTVWAARDVVLERRVAVKEVDASRLLDPSSATTVQDRVLREARIAARVEHPGVVRVFDVVEDDGRPWIVMEVLDGRSLGQVVADDGPLPPPRAAEVGLQVLDALEAAHRLGILHRDVKPGNVQVLDSGRVVLTDFGIASTTGDATATMSMTGEVVGSPAYMSPERARGLELTPAADLFSLGATLFHAVEGRPPFERDTPIATVAAVVHDPPAPMRVAGTLAPVLTGLLAKDPAQRWDGARARAGLRRALAGDAAATPAGEATQAVAAVTQAVPPAATQAVPVAATQAVPAVETRALPVAAPAEPAPHPASRVPAAPPTPPHGLPARRRRRRGPALAWGAAGLVLLVAGLLAGAGALVVRHQRGGGTAQAGGPYDPGQGGVPADWVRRTGPGYALATPAAWRRQTDGSALRWRGDGPYRYIAVFRASGADPRAVLDQLSGGWGDAHEGYADDGVRDTTFRGQRAAEWDLRYHDQVDLQARMTAVLLHGRVWVLWWQARPADWSGLLAERERVLSTFRA